MYALGSGAEKHPSMMKDYPLVSSKSDNRFEYPGPSIEQALATASTLVVANVGESVHPLRGSSDDEHAAYWDYDAPFEGVAETKSRLEVIH